MTTTSNQILVAVYGTLKRGLSNFESHLSDATFLGEWKSLPNFTMLDLGAYPGVIKGNTSVLIEVFQVNERQLTKLDILEDYPHLYTRELIETPYGKAFIYLLNIEHPDIKIREFQVISDGVWRE